MNSIMDAMTEVFRQVFDNPDIVLGPGTTANDIDGWDSLSHVNLIVALEMKFAIAFKQKEVLKFKNVGELARSIEDKLVRQ